MRTFEIKVNKSLLCFISPKHRLSFCLDTMRKLKQVREQCHGSRRTLTGAVIGWTRHELAPIDPEILTDWFDHARFDARKPTQRLMEFSKLAIALLMYDLPEKLTHGPVRFRFLYFLVFILLLSVLSCVDESSETFIFNYVQYVYVCAKMQKYKGHGNVCATCC